VNVPGSDPVHPVHPDDPAAWETQTTRTAWQNRWLTVLEDDVLLPDGRPYTYTRLEPAGIGVGVVGFDEQGRILLEREYRHGVGEVIWQLPGGLADDGEPLVEAGLRELREETGFQPAALDDDHVRYLGVVWDNPAFGVAASHIVGVRGLQPVSDVHRDLAEYVTLHWVEPTWMLEAVRTGEIRDRVVVAAVAHLLLNGWLAGNGSA
jgi:8-oxo-dGTP pyrophosphatase MutT (NUDIX family)